MLQKRLLGRILSIESIRELRRIKNRLSALKSLSDAGKLPLNQELKNWIDLREKLPRITEVCQSLDLSEPSTSQEQTEIDLSDNRCKLVRHFQSTALD